MEISLFELSRLTEAVYRNSRNSNKIIEKYSIDDPDEPENCVICLEEINPVESHNLLALGCGHLFHKTCILQNLEYNKKCPICRYTVTSI